MTASVPVSHPTPRRPPRGGRGDALPLTRFMVPPRRAVPPVAALQWRPLIPFLGTPPA
jgi:hypothetical protein